MPRRTDAGAFTGLPGLEVAAVLAARLEAEARQREARPELPPPAVDPRQLRWKLADGCRRLLTVRSVRNGVTGCGFTLPRRGDDDGQAHPVFRRERDRADRDAIAVDNLGWCGSARCPRCAPLVGEKLQDRVQALLDAAAAKRFGVAFGTLTGGHGRDTALVDERRNFAGAYTRLQRSKIWKEERERGLIGICRLWEATAGMRTGWHLHLHFLLIHRDGPEAAIAAGERLIARWQADLARHGWPTTRAAQDVRPITSAGGLPDYGVKAMTGWGAAAELAAGWRKEGRRPDRLTMPQLLGLAVAGDTWAADRYAEAVTALSGQRLFVLGPRLARELGVEPVELADGDAVEPEKRPGDNLGLLPAEVWNRLAKRGLRAWAYGEVKRMTADGIVWDDVAAVLTERAFRPPAPHSGGRLIEEEIRSPSRPRDRPPPPD